MQINVEYEGRALVVEGTYHPDVEVPLFDISSIKMNLPEGTFEALPVLQALNLHEHVEEIEDLCLNKLFGDEGRDRDNDLIIDQGGDLTGDLFSQRNHPL